ncbi:hypothetical protein O3P69_003516 [Scylla paramamosain]|uniref:Major facilitator superfamily (MFS) profile domain-containing protein n=1 Tax=Scylla paramamosain TaxID=85552 RepID=A0AAW0UH67_SCYPA
MKFKDESGWLRVVVCFAVLFAHHGLRDALITALPNIAASASPPSIPSSPATTSAQGNETYENAYIDRNINLTFRKRKQEETLLERNILTVTRTFPITDSVVVGAERESSAIAIEIHSLPYRSSQSDGITRNSGKNKSAKLRDSKIVAVRLASAHSQDWRSGRGGDQRQEEAVFEGGKFQSYFSEDYQLKEEWSLFLEGLVLSSVHWGWLFAALLADPLMDRLGVGVVMAVSVGVSGLLGLLIHAASLGGPWGLLGLRVVQGIVQGVSYPAVVRVLEGVPSAIRPLAALLVFLGPCVGTGVGAYLGSLAQWYVATYVVSSVAVVLTPLCLLLPSPPDSAPHKEVHWKGVLTCRGVWACVGVHVANTWVLHTLLVGLPFCLTYTHLDQPSASGWVVVAAAVGVCVAVRLQLFLAAKLTIKSSPTALNRRRIPVVAGTVMVTAALVVMATAGLDSMEVLVGVGVGLAGMGVGVTRVGYRLNVDDIAPLAAWRVTKILDTAGVVTAALSPLVVTALAQAGSSGWLSVWLVPLAALLPAGAAHLFLLTSNPQPWDDTATGAGENGAAVGAGGDVSVNGGATTLSVGRQSFKSARSALTFKTARSRSRTRTVSCRTIDDDLEGDMYSVANSNVDYRSVADEADQECVSVASSSTFKSDGADMHSVVDEADGVASTKKQPGHQFGSMLVNGGTADRTSVWLSSHHDLVLESGSGHSSKRADTHAANAIYGLLW